MPRPRSTDRRNSILSAATHVLAAEGLGASTASIAKAAGVSNGSLFVYFDTKATLLNELYLALKSEMGAAAVEGLPTESGPREQLQHMWNRWLHWATSSPEKRRTLALLDVSDDITAETHQTLHSAFSGIADLLERSRSTGSMRDAPLSFVLALTNALADTTADTMIREPDLADASGRIAFDAVWRMLA